MRDGKVLQGAETEIRQVGVVVKDLDKSVEFLTALGLGPFTVHQTTHPACTVRGRKTSYTVRLAISQLGPVQIELIEYQQGETIYKDFLDEKGAGLHHLCFRVRDLEATLDKFAEKGIDVIQGDKFVGGGGLAFLDTQKMGGFRIEVSQHPPDHDTQKGFKYQE